MLTYQLIFSFRNYVINPTCQSQMIDSHQHLNSRRLKCLTKPTELFCTWQLSNISNLIVSGAEMKDIIDGFDVQSVAAEILERGSSVGQTLSDMKQTVEEIDKQIKAQISSHHGKLLSQATSIESLEDILEVLRHHISTLQSSAERVTGRVAELFDKTQLRITQLERLHDTCTVLRAVIHVIHLSNKLEQLDSGNSAFKDLPKATQLIQEFNDVLDETNLKNIDVIEKDLAKVPKLNREALAQARLLLQRGLRGQNLSQVGVSLQAFNNLKCLPVELQKLFDSWIIAVEECLDEFGQKAPDKESHTGKLPGGAVMPHLDSSIGMRGNLNNRIDKLCEQIFTTHSNVSLLISILEKKRDSQTHKAFVEEFPLSEFDVFWTKFSSVVDKKLIEMPIYVRQTLENEYPKLMRQLNDTCRRFVTFSDNVSLESTGKAGESVSQSSQFAVEKIRKSFTSLEKAFLAKSLSRMFDSVNLVFSEDRAPSNQEISNIVEVLSSEMLVATVDAELFGLVAKNVVNTAKLFGVKAEGLMSTDGEATQVIGPLTAGQRRNVAVVNALHRFRTDILKMISNGRFDGIKVECLASIFEATDELLRLITGALQPLLDSISDAISAIIATVHQENFSQGASRGDDQQQQQCSLYLRELQQFIVRAQMDYLAPFSATDLVLDMTADVARRACREFIHHAVLVRPLGEGGKLRLAVDFAQMELAVSPLCRRITDVGPTYTLLRAIRPLLFESAEGVANCPAVGDVVPFSLAIHLLISMSPAELQSPHLTAGWSVSRYSQWLDDHTEERDRLQFLKGTLEAYARSVQASGKTEYVATYPLLLDLLKKGVEMVNA